MSEPNTIEPPPPSETPQMTDGHTPNRSAKLSRQIGITLPILLAIGLGGALVVRSGRTDTGTHPAPAASPNAPVAVSDAGRSAVQIKTVPARLSALLGQVETTGLVSYPADQTAKISPRLQGRIREVFVNVGDRVSVGQTLAVLDSVDAATAQTTAIQAQNKLQLARRTLDRQHQLYQLGTPEVTAAQAALDQAKANSQFKKDALDKIQEQAKIGGFSQLPLASARTATIQAQATLDSANQDLDLAQRARDRSSKLNVIGINAKQDLEAAENTLAKARVMVQADQNQLTLALETLSREQKAYKSNLYADQSVRSAQNDYQQALLQQQAAVRGLNLARTAISTNYQQAQSDFVAAQTDAQNSRNALVILGQPTASGLLRITAPVAGEIVERDVNPGQTVDQSQMTPWQMFTISNTKQVWVEGDIYEQDLASVAVGQPVEIHVDALPNHSWRGIVEHIASALDPKTHAIKVRAVLANPDGRLKDGMFAEMTVLTGHTQGALVVPLVAIQHDADSDYVYVASGNDYVRRNVILGKQKGDACLIQSGLHPGERVVTQGALFLGSQSSSG